MFFIKKGRNFMPNDYLQKLIETISLTEIFSKLGIEVAKDKALCPFHNDTNPSLQIYEDTHQFHCFACGAHGNIISLVKHVTNTDWKGAIAWLETEYPQMLDFKKKRDYLKISEISAIELAHATFRKMNENEKDYLRNFAEKRGFDDSVMLQNEICFANKDKLHTAFKDDKTSLEKLVDKNLIKSFIGRKDNVIRYKDFYKSARVIIPLFNYDNICKGFVARAYSDDNKYENKPKYIFNKGLVKSDILFNLNNVVQIIKEQSDEIDLYIVEGVFDAIRLQTKGILAVATLGSRITKGQVKSLIEALEKYNKNKAKISIILFLDSDEAGFKGKLQSIKNIWDYSLEFEISVTIVNDEIKKDPDLLFEGVNDVDSLKLLRDNTIDVFEFLLRYHIDKNEFTVLKNSEIKTEGAFRSISKVSERVNILSNIAKYLKNKTWRNVILFYKEVLFLSPSNYSLDLLSNYLQITSKDSTNKEITTSNEVQKLQKVRKAIDNTMASYSNEDIVLDTNTWDRIESCFDIWCSYFNREGVRNELNKLPLIEYKAPKKLKEDRVKMLYLHERLAFQQMMLNELLSGDVDGSHKHVPAVRYYSKDKKSLTTGVEEEVFGNKVVSFAYQIDMDSISCDTTVNRGMFRHYYECWKEFLKYLDEAAHIISGDKLFFVRLDIRKFYDCIPKYAVRNAIKNAIATLFDDHSSEKFSDIKRDCSKDDFLDWITDEVFNYNYIDSETGKLMSKESELLGIPQGPNISAYLANITLFKMDELVLKQINEWESEDKGEDENISTVYARYVDDMVIISNSSKRASVLRDIISSELNKINLELSSEKDDIQEKTRDEIEEKLSIVSNWWGSFVMESFEENRDDVIEETLISDYCDRERAKQLIRSMEVAVSSDDISSIDVIEGIFKTIDIRYADIVRLMKLIIRSGINKETDNHEEIIDLAKIREIWNENLGNAPSDSIIHREDVYTNALVDALSRLKNGHMYKHFNYKDQEEFAEIRGKITEFILASNELYDEVKKQWEKSVNKYVLVGKISSLYARTTYMREILDNIKTWEPSEYLRRWQYVLESGTNAQKTDNGLGGVSETIERFHFFVHNLKKVSGDADFKELRSLYIDNKGKQKENRVEETLQYWLNEEVDRPIKEHVSKAFGYLTNIVKAEVLATLLGSEISNFNEYIIGEGYNYMPVPADVDYTVVYGTNLKKESIGKAILDNKNASDENQWKKINGMADDINRFERPLDGFIAIHKYFEYICKKNGLWQIDNNCIKIAVISYKKLIEKLIENRTEDKSQALSFHNIFIKSDEDKIIEIEIFTELCDREKVSNKVWVSLQNDLTKIKEKPLIELNNEYWVAGQIILDALQLNKELMYERDVNYYYMKDLLDILSGNRFLNCVERTEKSYKATIDKNMGLADKFLLLGDDEKKLFLNDKDIINGFISNVLGKQKKYYGQGIQQYILSDWANNSIRHIYKEVLEKKVGVNIDGYDSFRREVAALWSLADKVNFSSEYIGFQAFKKALWLRIVSQNIRLQIQELCTFNSLSDLKKLMDEKRDRDLLLDCLGLNPDEVKLSYSPNVSYSLIKKALYEHKVPTSFNYITPIGMLIMLCELIELNEPNKVMKHIIKEKDKKSIEKGLKELADFLTSSGEASKEKTELNYPFDEFDQVLRKITRKKIDESLNTLGEIDNSIGLQISVEKSQVFSIKRKSGKYDFLIGSEPNNARPITIYRQAYPDGKPFQFEEETSSGRLVYTLTKINNIIIGISMISKSFSNIAFPKTVAKDSEDDEIETETETETEEIVTKNNVETCSKESSKNNDCKDRSKPIDCKEETKEMNFEGVCAKLLKLQSSEWGDRKKENLLYDRIAIFQFDGGNSYLHPMDECDCNSENQSEDLYSFTEQRRQKLIGRAIDICSYFGVEILLLPEYSVRPETVRFICEKIENIELSVWAGTFKVFPGYKEKIFSKLNTSKEFKMNNHEAILPVVVSGCEEVEGADENKKEDYKSKLIIERAKKYPSIAMQEVINPTRHCDSPILPIMAKELRGKRLFFDARDDVTECICSEFFLMSTPANHVTMINSSFALYKRHFRGKANFGNYRENCFKDVQHFGKHTALSSPIGKYSRRSIVLIPAYTTRGCDHYIIAQASYLGSGLTTVFCNSVNKSSNGGSCFIGTNSWDMRVEKKIEGEISIVPDYCVYNGLEPGIYKQHSQYENRGALSDNEQALLICDINPNNSAPTKPNYETAIKPLDLVAHIPFIEVYGEGKADCKSNRIRTSKSFNKKDIELCGFCNEDAENSIFCTLENRIRSINVL